MKLELATYESKMKKSISVFEEDLATISAGRANPAVLNGINVDYYGAPTAINAVAEVKVTDARTICITPWDNSMCPRVKKYPAAKAAGSR